ncbi:MAG: hypothetical protein A3K16_02465 [Omnitrophica bacterium RIFCSPLOWO2_01_FULL_45_24]|nr:MAG: hypothetical protein A3K16_02465 [Omnitrophica bacterium RIFCSPLOWO2_01_FULL_45_24]
MKSHAKRNAIKTTVKSASEKTPAVIVASRITAPAMRVTLFKRNAPSTPPSPPFRDSCSRFHGEKKVRRRIGMEKKW